MTRFSFSTAAVLLVAGSAHADVFNLQSDWSEVSNPNGAWTLREGTNALPHVASWQNAIGGWNTAQPAWAKSQDSNNRLPVFLKSNGSENFVHDWTADQVVVHSTDASNGVGSGLANVLFTVPTSGTLSISGGVWLGRDISRAVDWSIVVNGTTVTGGSLFSGDAFNRLSPFAFSAGSGGSSAITGVSILANDQVELRLTTAGSGAGDFVGIDLTVTTTVPTPGSAGLLAVLAVAAQRRRRGT